MKISALYVYPIKSCGRIKVGTIGPGQQEVFAFTDNGCPADRMYVLVGEDGKHITQREESKLATVSIEAVATGINAVFPGSSRFFLKTVGCDDEKIARVKVHRDDCWGYDVGNEAATIFSDFLGRQCRLLRHSDQHPRMRRPDCVQEPFWTTYTDGYPFLVVSEASLQDLNSRLKKPVPMNRFRPNIVVTGCEPYAEDNWNWIFAGDPKVRLIGAKLCVRCIITTTDQDTGVRNPEKEPLTTLNTYRNFPGLGPCFGKNFVNQNMGLLHVGDEIEVG